MELLSDVLKTKKKQVIIFNAVFLGILIALMIIFTFFDLQFSQAIVNPKSPFAIAFFIVGYVPAIFVDSVLFAAAFYLVKSKWLKALFAYLTGMTMAGAIYTVFESFTVHNAVKFSVMGVGAVIGAVAIIYFFRNLSPETLKKIIYIFVIGAVMAILSFIFVGGLQMFWGRDRYYSFAEFGGEFTKWFIPQGMSGDVKFQSFPSLHSSSAASMVMLMLVAWKFKTKKITTIILYSVASLIMICVPLSRVVAGWHFMTDTIVAVIIAYGAFIIGIVVTDAIYRRLERKKEERTVTEDTKAIESYESVEK